MLTLYLKLIAIFIIISPVFSCSKSGKSNSVYLKEIEKKMPNMSRKNSARLIQNCEFITIHEWPISGTNKKRLHFQKKDTYRVQVAEIDFVVYGENTTCAFCA